MQTVLGLPIPEIKLLKNGASAVVLANHNSRKTKISGLEEAMNSTHSDLRIFGKPSSRPFRRMAVTLTYRKMMLKNWWRKLRADENFC